ncbi:MAG TPA: xanthine dehydrogenase family protein subunit M [Kiritimatiellia bacterium]|nr:xanthine dehydrogenase family protein subunit M [Kiritimatiellia bacterium]
MNTLEQTEMLQPATLAEALRLQADESTRGLPLAGGTDLMVQWEAGVRPPPPRVLNVKGLPELMELRVDGATLVVGAGVTHAALHRSPLVRQHAPSLADAASEVGGAQIQALGTIGGSIGNASPAGDLASSLLVADAEAEVASASGTRRVALAKLLAGYRKLDLQPDELIVRFHLPGLPAGAREGWRKLGPRAAQAISKVMGSYRGRVKDGRIASFAVALGSVAPTAVRLPGVEQWLIGRAIDEETLAGAEQRVAAEVNPIADIRSTAEYRRWVSGRLVRHFLEHLAGAS